MKLLLEEINKKWVLYNEFELNKEFVKSVWVFYSLYDICLSICKIEDKRYKLKNVLIMRFISNPTLNNYDKIKKMMVKDIEVINNAMNLIENVEEGGVQIGDYKKPTMFAISIYE